MLAVLFCLRLESTCTCRLTPAEAQMKTKIFSIGFVLLILGIVLLSYDWKRDVIPLATDEDYRKFYEELPRQGRSLMEKLFGATE